MQQVLKDTTMFSYMFFQLNGVPLKLYPYQDIILSDTHSRKIFRSARQVGKSLALDIKAAHNICLDHGHHHNECIISLSLDQAKFQMRRVKSLLSSAKFDWKASKGETENVSIITVDIKDDKGKVKYSNLLVCTPCTGSSLGYDFHEVNLDEFEYWDIDIRHFYNNIIEPTTYTTDGNVTIFSNPNGTESYVASLEELKLPNGKKKFHTYIFDFTDYPGRTQEDLEYAKAGKNRQEIESQLLAIRSLSSKYYFSADEVEQSYSAKLEGEKEWHATGKETYWFLDVGAKIDQSFLVGATIEPDEEKPEFIHVNAFIVHAYPIGYPLSRVVGSHDVSQETDGWEYHKSVKEHLEEYRLAKGVNPVFGCDATGNTGIIPLFKSVNIFPLDIQFSGPRKWAMYQRMKYYLEKKLLHRIKCDEFDKQTKRIVVTRLKTSAYNRVGHENEDDHDDAPDAFAGLIHICDNPITVTPGITVLNNSEPTSDEPEDRAAQDEQEHYNLVGRHLGRKRQW